MPYRHHAGPKIPHSIQWPVWRSLLHQHVKRNANAVNEVDGSQPFSTERHPKRGGIRQQRRQDCCLRHGRVHRCVAGVHNRCRSASRENCPIASGRPYLRALLFSLWTECSGCEPPARSSGAWTDGQDEAANHCSENGCKPFHDFMLFAERRIHSPGWWVPLRHRQPHRRYRAQYG